MPEPKQQLNRRHTDGDRNEALRAAQRAVAEHTYDLYVEVRAAHRAIAEHAYHLYVEGGCDRSRVAEYWRLAEQAWLDHPAMESESPAVAVNTSPSVESWAEPGERRPM